MNIQKGCGDLSGLSAYFHSDYKNVPYHDTVEHLQDHLSLIKTYLEAVDVLSEDDSNQAASLTQAIESAWAHISSREEASLEKVHLPLITLRETLQLSFYEYLCLLSAVSVELDESLCKTFTSLCGSPYATFHLAMCFLGITDPIEEDLFKSADLVHSSLRLLLNMQDSDLSDLSLMRHPLSVRKNVMLYLTNALVIDDDYCSLFTFNEALNPAPLHQETISRLSTYVSNSLKASSNLRQAVLLEGAPGIGKKTIIKQICKTHQINCIFLDAKSLECLNPAALNPYVTDLCLKLLLENALLCIFHCSDNNAGLCKIIINKLKPMAKIVLLCFDHALSKPFHSHSFSMLTLKLNPPTLVDKITIWSYMKERYKLDVEPKYCAGKYAITIGRLDAILKNCKLTASYEGLSSISEKHVIQGILSSNTETSNTYLLKHPYSFKDIVLDAKTMETLMRICNYVKYRYTVFEEWGYSHKLAYGRGISMLFYGAPGTGKTMCASVLANEWGLDLVKVDLSQIMDKYIGETEKKLDAVFSSAQENNCVLFFDEADALFSKRTEINSSNDKYANIEVSHLLQKIELYDGIVILASNLVQNFDEAFKRRINFMLRFNLPSSEIRKELWQKVFPLETPLSDDIDFDLLAEKYEFSPSIIKSIALYAAFLAASQADCITMSHILEGIKYEYEKTGKLMPY